MKLSIFNDFRLLPGVNKKLYAVLYKLFGGNRIIDMLLHAPTDIIDRLNVPKLNVAKAGDIVLTSAKVLMHIPPLRKRGGYQIICSAGDIKLTLVFFNSNKHYLHTILPLGAEKVISGKIVRFATIIHPDYIVDKLTDIKEIEPVYPLARGVGNKLLLNLIQNVLTLLPEFPEWISSESINKHQWQSFTQSIINLHNPQNKTSLMKSKERLGCDEFLSYQLRLQMLRYESAQKISRVIKGDHSLRDELANRLPFVLTNSQQKVIKEITEDQAKPKQMLRLLQGDVGSGKTVVVLFAILNAIECGGQAAFMVPTEILAIQHTNWIASLFGDVVKVRLLTGKLKTIERRNIESELMNGEIKILVGTHALFQDQLKFKELTLVVIDEQHRFGVKQRDRLVDKGDNADVLLMSATPIPRTLYLALYGDIDCSILDEKPAQRLPIQTNIVHKKSLNAVFERIKCSVQTGAKVYWVCPLIEGSETIEMTAAIDRFNQLETIVGEKVGLIHGKMKTEEREAVVLKFKNGQINILVATTVIEVGIDIPDATIMIIENAEKFGLSQLHQLRGRVGRGVQQSFCLLIYENASKNTCKRLQTVQNSDDGFYIAEQDLKIRGSGEIIGRRQSGLLNFKFVDLQDYDMPFSYIHKLALDTIFYDPALEQHQHLKTLIEMFNHCDQAFG